MLSEATAGSAVPRQKSMFDNRGFVLRPSAGHRLARVTFTSR